VGAVVNLQLGRPSADGVGDERGEPVPVDVVNRNCAPRCGRSRRTSTRDPAGQEVRSSASVISVPHTRPVPRPAVEVVGRFPGVAGDGEDGDPDVGGDGGLGIRETPGLITDDGATFVPHRIPG
jgi:hypothetical protein